MAEEGKWTDVSRRKKAQKGLELSPTGGRNAPSSTPPTARDSLFVIERSREYKRGKIAKALLAANHALTQPRHLRAKVATSYSLSTPTTPRHSCGEGVGEIITYPSTDAETSNEPQVVNEAIYRNNSRKPTWTTEERTIQALEKPANRHQPE